MNIVFRNTRGRSRRLLVSLICAAACAAHAQQHVVVADAWARPTVPGQTSGGGYLRIDNTGGGADRLLGASTDVAAAAELHSMTLDKDVMRMRKVEAIDIPPGGSVELKPGGLHLMLIGLKTPLVAGTSFALTLRFEKAGDVKVQAEVAAHASEPAHEPKHKH